MMQISPELARRAREAAQMFDGEAIELKGISNHFLTRPDAHLGEFDRRLAELVIDGENFLIFTRIDPTLLG